MLKIVVGGALNKNENAALIEQYGNGQVEVKVMGDLQAAMALKYLKGGQAMKANKKIFSVNNLLGTLKKKEKRH